MQRPPLLTLSVLSALIAATLLTGCGSAKKSPLKSSAWQTVKAVPHSGPLEKSPPAAYAARLHKTLQCAGIAHKVITVKFRYQAPILRDREGEDTAVIYRDTATPAHPWWLMSERLANPMWLPSKPLASQAAFYLSRPVRIVKVEDFPAKKTACGCSGGKSAFKPVSHRSKPGAAGKKPAGHSA